MWRRRWQASLRAPGGHRVTQRNRDDFERPAIYHIQSVQFCSLLSKAVLSLLPCLLFVVGGPPLHAQQLAKKLILKDGSYQLVTQWEVHGDRVRYYSAEREAWEEVPNSLVDWDATSKAEKENTLAPLPEAAEIDKERQEDKQNEVAASPQVATGLRLPPDSSVMLLDTYDKQPQLDELDQQGGAVDQDERPGTLRSAIDPLAGRKQIIQIEGLHARVQSHVTVPAIYINLVQNSENGPEQPQQAQQPWDRFHIVRVEEKKNKRIVGAVKVSMLGKVSQQQNLVPTTSQRISNVWVKLTPDAPLQAGEYVVAEMEGNRMNAYVWDFGVNPSAPANPNSLKPENPSAPPQAQEPKVQER